MDDATLLHTYAAKGDQAAFTEVVRRHLNTVYSVALRQVGGDAQLAQDVAQSVFADVARKAAALADHAVLDGWLFTSTRFAAAKLVRRERIRQAHEQKAFAMQCLDDDGADHAHWSDIRPVLDEVLSELKPAERDAVLLRFYSGDGYAAVGAKLRISEDAARMRVERALEQLRVRLARRGVTSTAAALAGVLVQHAVVAAPPGMVATVSSGALAMAAGGTWVSAFFAMTKLQISLAGLLVLAGTAGLVLQGRTNAALENEVSTLNAQSADIPSLRADNARLAHDAAEADALRSDAVVLAKIDGDAAALRSRLATASADDAGAVGTLDGAPVFDIAKVEVKPKLTTRAEPTYPPALRASGEAGNAVLDFIIDAKGNVRNVRAVRSTRAEFESPAIEAVSQWKYAPGAKAGTPVNTHVQMTVRFTTDKNEPKHGAH